MKKELPFVKSTISSNHKRYAARSNTLPLHLFPICSIWGGEPLKKLIVFCKGKLSKLSFKTGVIVLACCIPCYIISFAQMALDIDAKLKGVLWVVFFGMAKTFQYSGLTILGVEGIKRLKAIFKRS